MLLKLFLKDFLAYKNITFLIYLLHMVLAGLLIFRYSSWNNYMMYGYIIITYTSVFYFFREKMQKSEILTASLPVTRFTTVVAKYIGSMILALFGIGLWFLNAFLADKIFLNSETHFREILYLKVLFMALFFIIVHKSIFMPAVFRFRMFGIILMFLVSWIVAILSIPLIFSPYKLLYNPYFTKDDVLLIVVLTFIMVVAPFISFYLSVKIYRNRDL